MPTEAKRETVAELREAICAAPDVHRLGVPGPQGERSRRHPARAAQAGRDYHVVKNRLMRIAADGPIG